MTTKKGKTRWERRKEIDTSAQRAYRRRIEIDHKLAELALARQLKEEIS